jgi:hypothetical protein
MHQCVYYTDEGWISWQERQFPGTNMAGRPRFKKAWMVLAVPKMRFMEFTWWEVGSSELEVSYPVSQMQHPERRCATHSSTQECSVKDHFTLRPPYCI